ncbi:MAG: N-acetyl-gamma-glutamyl-phosphate reductase [Planctomycetota bacterium]|jgi:N-acetyl-gamma-glutamyl-phosphate reductase
MPADKKIRVAIIGAEGYTSRETIHLSLVHPQMEIAAVCSPFEPLQRIDELFPEFTGRVEMQCEPIEPASLEGRADMAMLCVPSGISMTLTPALLKAGLRVIDFSADYRLKEAADYQQWYDTEHSDPANLAQAVYGLPELYRDKIGEAALVANPGCYPTSAGLGIVPLLKAHLVDPQDIVVDSASGMSGAGRTPTPATHYTERNENFEAYKVGEHRHQVEIERTLDPYVRSGKSSVLFVPHLIPMERGILSTIYLKPLQPVSVEHVTQVFTEAYDNEPFIRLRKDLPSTLNVARTNFCDLTVRVVKSRIVVLSAIDNMVKGAAGQAVQNMNVMFGIDETAGLI